MAESRVASVLLALAVFASAQIKATQDNWIRLQPTRDKFYNDAGFIWSSSANPKRTSDEQLTHYSASNKRTRILDGRLLLKSSRSLAINDFKFEFDNLLEQQKSSGSFTSSAKVDSIDGNQIEVKLGDYYGNTVTIQDKKVISEKTQKHLQAQQFLEHLDHLQSKSSARRVTLPRISMTKTDPGGHQGLPELSRSYKSRHAPLPKLSQQQGQTNLDIQDIITGIVKLLNDKVNVAVSFPKPVRQSIRINNRGPPKISDVSPLLLDFDTPGLNLLPEHSADHEKPSSRPLLSQTFPGPHQFSTFFSGANILGSVELEQPQSQPQQHHTNSSWIWPKRQSTSQPSFVEKRNTESFSSSSKIVRETINAEMSSSVQVIESTSTTTMLNPSAVPPIHIISPSSFSNTALKTKTSLVTTMSFTISSIMTLEPSRSSTIESSFMLSFPTPIEGLSTNVPYQPTSQSISSLITFSEDQSSLNSYRPRPGIVLDDTLDYVFQNVMSRKAYGPPRHSSNPDTFDVVVSAIQGPGESSGGEIQVSVNVGHAGYVDGILTSSVEGQGFVSIEGKRTYLNLFDNKNESDELSIIAVQPTKTQKNTTIDTRFAVPQTETKGPEIKGGMHQSRPNTSIRRSTFYRRPSQSTMRIDTCIVGDSSTCDASQHEACTTIHEVSACHCKPGYARLVRSLPCKKIVSILISIRVDKIYDRRIVWNEELGNQESEFYHTLVFEANKAIESAISMTPFSDNYVTSLINNVYQGDTGQGQGGVFVNATLKMAFDSLKTARLSLAGELQKHLLGVIQRRYNNIGNSVLFVENLAGSISNLQDLDECASPEMNDCHSDATCTNTWGSFTCSCNYGFRDPHKSDHGVTGRVCLACPSSYCNNRGPCFYHEDQMQCACGANYYGIQCEINGEVLGVAIGSSAAALIIIALTLFCLIMWSRKWSREQKMMCPVYGYVPAPLPGSIPGSVETIATVEQGPPMNFSPHMWAHVADQLKTTELMDQIQSSSAMFSHPTLSMQGTLLPQPLPRLQAPARARRLQSNTEFDSSNSELQDKDLTELIPQSTFQMPRPCSRSSLANQSGIYYDVEFDREDAWNLSKNNIPMSTYTMAPYYRT